jgi:cytidylate kinase
MIVTISGKSGCGNTTVSRMVAESLGLRHINYTFHDIAIERGISFEELHERATDDPEVDRYLDERQIELAKAGDCVLGSRLAIWLIKDADVRVYLDGPIDVRAARIATRESLALEYAIAATAERDATDRRRYIQLYGIDIDDTDQADLVVDTAAADQYGVAAQIIAAVKAKQGE